MTDSRVFRADVPPPTRGARRGPGLLVTPDEIQALQFAEQVLRMHAADVAMPPSARDTYRAGADQIAAVRTRARVLR